ncbi:threonylcarbamoyl-AMP synthase [Candidatus Pacearchaeota archaeon]|nr:threonylcarbamoyl-AMP synthase [Candidatus Pacearchaeota archaeon]|tara:strand:- start:15976 stop:16545 length:570 start_codon:yes stop_codon:yes gene_type:complete
MKVVKKEEFLSEKEFYINEMKAGKVFVYGTDTIYGIGCNALSSEGVLKIRRIKQRDEKPFSVIAPSKKWISENCFVSGIAQRWVDKLPGAYTLILELNNWNVVSPETNGGGSTLGVRIPKHWFSDIISESGVPFVTTSVNLTGQKGIQGLSDLSEDMRKEIDYFVDEGVIEGEGSTVVKLVGDEEEILR